MVAATIERTDKPVSFYLPPELVGRLDRVAKREDRTRSSAARQAIAEYLERKEQEAGGQGRE